jgi:hypothetical protein
MKNSLKISEPHGFEISKQEIPKSLLLFTIVMKVLVSGTENPNFEVLDELRLFIDKK